MRDRTIVFMQLCSRAALLLLLLLFNGKLEASFYVQADQLLVRQIAKKLSSEDRNTIRQGFRELRKLDEEEQLLFKASLVELADHKDSDLRRESIEMLIDFGVSDAEVICAIEKHIEDDDPSIQAMAATFLVQIGGPSEYTVRRLLDLIKSKDDNARSIAEGELCKLGPKLIRSLDRILELHRDPEEPVRRAATNLLGFLGPEHRGKVESVLGDALNDPSLDVRMAAAMSLQRIDGELEKAVQVLMEMTQSKTVDLNRRMFAINILGRLGSDSAPSVPYLVRILELEDPDTDRPMLQVEAVNALGRMGHAAEAAVPVLSKVLTQNTKRHSAGFGGVICVSDCAAYALASIGEAGVPALVEALENKNASMRVAITRALSNLPHASDNAIEALASALKDPNPNVRMEAILALNKSQIRSPAVLQNLVPLLFDTIECHYLVGCFGGTRKISHQAAQALIHLNPKPEEVVPGLIQAIANADAITLEAIEVLCRFREDAKAAKGPLEKLLNSGISYRAIAFETMRRLGIEGIPETPDRRLSAAAALAVIDPGHAQIQSILEIPFDSGKIPDPLVCVGIERLAAAGVKFDEPFKARLTMIAEESNDLVLWSALCRMNPSDQRFAKKLVQWVDEPNLTGSPQYLDSMTEVIIDLSRHKSVQNELIGLVSNKRQSLGLRIWAARILIASLGESEEVSTFLSVCAREGELSEDVLIYSARDLIDLLLLCPMKRRESLFLLTKLLPHDSRAAELLYRYHGQDQLIEHLDHADVSARTYVVRAFGEHRLKAVPDSLLRKLSDVDPIVRLETVRVLGVIGRKNPHLRPNIRPALIEAGSDRRRIIRDEAKNVMIGWDAE